MEKFEVHLVDKFHEPVIITAKNEELSHLEDKVNVAIKRAEDAKKYAVNASDKKDGFFKKKDTFGTLQTVAVEIAESQMIAAEAQKVSFEYQKKLSEIAQYLFNISVANIATNRSLYKELQLRLRNASEEELSDLARKEVEEVAKQLKEQENILTQLSNLTKKAQEQTGEINQLKKQENEQDFLLKSLIENTKTIDRKLVQHSQKDEEYDLSLKKLIINSENHNMQFAIIDEVKKAYDQLFADLAAKCETYDTLFEEKSKKDASQDQEIELHCQKDYELEELIVTQNEKSERHDELLFGLRTDNDMYQQVIAGQANEISQLLNELRLLKDSKTDKKTTSLIFVLVGLSLFAFILQLFL